MHGKTAARHTSQEFVAFLEEVVGQCRKNQEIHIVLDNLSAHKTKKVAEFLDPTPERETALHSDVLIVAESGGDLVRTNRARCNRPWSLHVGQGPGAEVDAVHSRLRRVGTPDPLEVLRRCAADHMLTNSLRQATRAAVRWRWFAWRRVVSIPT